MSINNLFKIITKHQQSLSRIYILSDYIRIEVYKKLNDLTQSILLHAEFVHLYTYNIVFFYDPSFI